jgi:hypothetical protein
VRDGEGEGVPSASETNEKRLKFLPARGRLAALPFGG